MCVTLIMEPEGKKNVSICNSLVGKSYCFPNFFFSLCKFGFLLYLVSQEGQGVEFCIQGAQIEETH